jgi:hypothetical protein
VLAQVKNNLAAPQPSLVYRVGAGTGSAPSLEWLGTSPLNADDLLAASGRTSPLSTADARACDFLAGILEDGPHQSREIWQLAQQQDLSERTLHRAKIKMKIRTQRVYLDDAPRSYWSLNNHALPEEVAKQAAASATPNLDAYLAALEKQYPPPSPLDDL